VVRWRTTALGIAVLASALTGLRSARAQDADERPPRGALFYPTGPGRGELRIAVGALLDILPRRLVESETRTIPRVTANARYGLPWGFTADARMSAIVVSNEVQIGAAWAHEIAGLAFSLHEHFGVWYGVVGASGFDTRAWGVLNTPGASLGLPIGDTRLTGSFELLLLQGQHVTVGEASLDKHHVSYEGFISTLIVENMLAGGGVFYLGTSLVYSRPDYQLWLAFSDTNKKQVYPRFMVGYEF
jgi:hypothetical protein